MKTALSVWLLMLLAAAEAAEAAAVGGDEGADSAPAPGLQPPAIEEGPSVRASGGPVTALRPLREGERAVYLVDLATDAPPVPAAAAAAPPLGDVNSLERPGPLSKLFNPASASGLYDDPAEADAEKTRKKRTFCLKCGGGGGGYGGHGGYGGGGYGGGHGGGGFTGGLTISIGGGFRGSKGFHKGGGGGGWGGGGWGGQGGGGGCGYGGCRGGGHGGGGGGYVVQPVIVKQPIYVPSGGHRGGGGGGCGYGGCGGGGGCGYGGCGGGGGGGHGGSYSFSQSSAQSSAGSYNWGKK